LLTFQGFSASIVVNLFLICNEKYYYASSLKSLNESFDCTALAAILYTLYKLKIFVLKLEI